MDYKTLILDWAERHKAQLGGLVTYDALVEIANDGRYKTVLEDIYNDLLQIGLGV